MSVPIVGEFNTTPATYGSGQKMPLQATQQGYLIAAGSVAAGTSAGAVMTGSWVRLLAENKQRATLLLQNIGSNNVGIYFAPPGNNNVTPVPAGIGSAGVYTMVPTGTYAPPPIPTGEVWAIGTVADIVDYCEA